MPAHTALSVKQFVAQNHVTIFHHPPLTAPCHFFLPQIKSALKKIRLILLHCTALISERPEFSTVKVVERKYVEGESN